jgi:hypothetical protein
VYLPPNGSLRQCVKNHDGNALLIQEGHYLCSINKIKRIMAKKNEEYAENKSRDWMIFWVSTVAMLAILWFKPEWVWVVWPFQFTALAGALGRL